MISMIKNKVSRCGITTRIIISFTILVIVPFLITAGVMGFVFKNYAISSIGETTVDAMASVGAQISQSVKKYEEDSMVLYHTDYVGLLKNDGISEYGKKQIESALKSACFSDTGIHAIYVTTPSHTFKSGSYMRLLEIMEPYEEEIIKAGGACRWYPTNQLLGEEKENKYILARSLNDGWEKNVGILYMVVDDRMIKSAFEQLRSDYSERYLVDAEGKILYCEDDKQLGNYLDISSINPKKLDSYQQVENDGEKQILVSRHLMNTGWYCISLISSKQLRTGILQLEIPLAVAGGIYVLFLLLMLRLMRKYVFAPLKVLKKNMDQYAQGELEVVHMERVGVGEFASLSRHFNDMTMRISDLMKKYQEEVDEKNRQRMLALTSQLKPHFVYNALNTIKWMAVLNHQENIQHMTESLVNIFMNVAKVDDDNYLLKDELELVKNYVVIQKARFMNFELIIEDDENCLNCKIRKFLLQPIVENAIVHGLGRGKIRNTQILIRAWMSDCLYITVRDEGIGFDVEKWRSSPAVAEDHMNIGLHNVEQIIHLEYGEPYRLEIESAPGKGTTMKYILPIQRKEDGNDQDNYRG